MWSTEKFLVLCYYDIICTHIITKKHKFSQQKLDLGYRNLQINNWWVTWYRIETVCISSFLTSTEDVCNAHFERFVTQCTHQHLSPRIHQLEFIYTTLMSTISHMPTSYHQWKVWHFPLRTPLGILSNWVERNIMWWSCDENCHTFLGQTQFTKLKKVHETMKYIWFPKGSNWSLFSNVPSSRGHTDLVLLNEDSRGRSDARYNWKKRAQHRVNRFRCNSSYSRYMLDL